MPPPRPLDVNVSFATDRTVAEIARRIPSGSRPSTAVPQEAAAGVLAREPK